MTNCEKCKHTGLQCCYNCGKDAGRCDFWHDCGENCSSWTPRTVFDEIKRYDEKQLAGFIHAIAYGRETPWDDAFSKECCEKCPSIKCVMPDTGKEMEFHECDFSDGKCPHGDPIIWWLKRKAEESKNENAV